MSTEELRCDWIASHQIIIISPSCAWSMHGMSKINVAVLQSTSVHFDISGNNQCYGFPSPFAKSKLCQPQSSTQHFKNDQTARYYFNLAALWLQNSALAKLSCKHSTIYPDTYGLNQRNSNDNNDDGGGGDDDEDDDRCHISHTRNSNVWNWDVRWMQ